MKRVVLKDQYFHVFFVNDNHDPIPDLICEVIFQDGQKTVVEADSNGVLRFARKAPGKFDLKLLGSKGAGTESGNPKSYPSGHGKLPVLRLCNEHKPYNCGTSANPVKGLGPLGNQFKRQMYYDGENRKDLVGLLQTMLNKHYHSDPPIDTDKTFGGDTEDAVEKFQTGTKDFKGNLLNEDCLVGPRTSDALNRAMVGKWYEYYPTPKELDERKLYFTVTSDYLAKGLEIDPGKVNQAKVFVVGSIICSIVSSPTLLMPKMPGSSEWIPIDGLFAYISTYPPGTGDTPSQVDLYLTKNGCLTDTLSGRQAKIKFGREVYMYFSHRSDLRKDHLNRRFSRNIKKGLPLIGPVLIPCTPDPQVQINIWDQNDWVIVQAVELDGDFPDNILMAEQKPDYIVSCQPDRLNYPSWWEKMKHFTQKESQELFGSRGARLPVSLVKLKNITADEIYIGTLSELPSAKAKLLLTKKISMIKEIHVGSLNDIKPTPDNNQNLQAMHQYNGSLVDQLSAIKDTHQKKKDKDAIDAIPDPPNSYLLSGDIPWQEQKGENCGAWGFAFCMNYWFPYTNNPEKKDGEFYRRETPSLLLGLHGARTPDMIITAANKFNMNGRDNDAEHIDKTRALKLLKLWVYAGIPVMVLVEEYYDVRSLHWKVVVGWDGDRIFFNNSGADDETTYSSHQDHHVDYEHAQVGNDVSQIDEFFDKWEEVGLDILIIDFVDGPTSVDRRTFIPIYPKEAKFRGTKAR